jgi:hypothetical protein
MCFGPGGTLQDSVCDITICVHSNLNGHISIAKVIPSKANTRGPAERKQTSLSKGKFILSCYRHILIHTLAAAVQDEDDEPRDKEDMPNDKDYCPKQKASPVSEESTHDETDFSIAEVGKLTGSKAKVPRKKKSQR